MLLKEKADNREFAEFQTKYSDADYNMWYDMFKKLRDTAQTEECFFVTSGGKRIGGYVSVGDIVCFPFLAAPYEDRREFWSFVLEEEKKKYINGVSENDAEVLQELGFSVASRSHVMSRPTEKLTPDLRDPFTAVKLALYFSPKTEEQLGRVISNVYYPGSGLEEFFGNTTVESAVADMKDVFEAYGNNNYSLAVVDRVGTPVAVCLAGRNDDGLKDYSEITNVCVLPEYRGRGIARYMVGSVLAEAGRESPYMKLMVREGNPAERFFEKMGFDPGPVFVNLVKNESKRRRLINGCKNSKN